MKSTTSRIDVASDALRQRIGDMAEGVPLPPVPQLMAELNVGRVTLDRVYDRLEAEGWIKRMRGKGVFAADPRTTGELAIVMRPEALAGGRIPFFPHTCSLLIQTLQHRLPQWQARIHTGWFHDSDRDFAAELDLLKPDVFSQLRGVVTFHPLFDLEDHFFAQGVPVITLSQRPARCSIFHDVSGFYDLALQHLVGRGIKRIGILSVASSQYQEHAHGMLDQKLDQMRAIYDIQIKPQWCHMHVGRDNEQGGYEMLHRLWSEEDRPDAVIVPDDRCCTGVLRAASELKIKLPDSLRLVTHTVKHLALPFHMPVTRVQTDAQDIVDQALSLVDQFVFGKHTNLPEQVPVPGQLIEGCST